jgi:hypothetical protein
MKNKLQDLRDHLFEQLERVKDADTPDELDREVKRANAMIGVAGQITATAKLEVDYARVTGLKPTSGFIPNAELEVSGTPQRPQLAAGGSKRS